MFGLFKNSELKLSESLKKISTLKNQYKILLQKNEIVLNEEFNRWHLAERLFENKYDLTDFINYKVPLVYLFQYSILKFYEETMDKTKSEYNISESFFVTPEFYNILNGTVSGYFRYYFPKISPERLGYKFSFLAIGWETQWRGHIASSLFGNHYEFICKYWNDFYDDRGFKYHNLDEIKSRSLILGENFAPNCTDGSAIINNVENISKPILDIFRETFNG